MCLKSTSLVYFEVRGHTVCLQKRESNNYVFVRNVLNYGISPKLLKDTDTHKPHGPGGLGVVSGICVFNKC